MYYRALYYHFVEIISLSEGQIFGVFWQLLFCVRCYRVVLWYMSMNTL
jgi:hypothetical protein